MNLHKNNLYKALGKLNSKISLRLRLLFLVPLGISIAALIIILVFVIYKHENTGIQQDVLRIQMSAQEFYNDSIRYDTHALLAIHAALRHNVTLEKYFSNRNRTALLIYAQPMFESLKRDFNITHFYFIKPDKVTLLRVHTPQRYGDTIKRITMRQAVLTGGIMHGVEIGPLGTFTLRVVSPWYQEHTHKLMGYVELGMEIDRVLEQMRQFFGVKVFVLVNKKYLHKDTWESGMRALGRIPHWNQFPNFVLGGQSSQDIPKLIEEKLQHGGIEGLHSFVTQNHEKHFNRLITLPLKDADNRAVAELLILANVSQQVQDVRHTMLVGSMGSFGIGLLLFGFFYWLVGKIAHRIEFDEISLQQLATHDGLTGLYNHRSFYRILEEELKRARRYSRELSLLMIDIDHFKAINDAHGHQAGDLVLKEFAELLNRASRVNDSICRYGGEEIMIIMPETDDEQATKIAERIRAMVAENIFNVSQENPINITISIGLTSNIERRGSIREIVSAVDQALYDAKEGGRNCVRKK